MEVRFIHRVYSLGLALNMPAVYSVAGPCVFVVESDFIKGLQHRVEVGKKEWAWTKGMQASCVPRSLEVAYLSWDTI